MFTCATKRPICQKDQIYILQVSRHFIDYQNQIIRELKYSSEELNERYDHVVQQISAIILHLMQHHEGQPQEIQEPLSASGANQTLNNSNPTDVRLSGLLQCKKSPTLHNGGSVSISTTTVNDSYPRNLSPTASDMSYNTSIGHSSDFDHPLDLTLQNKRLNSSSDRCSSELENDVSDGFSECSRSSAVKKLNEYSSAANEKPFIQRPPPLIARHEVDALIPEMRKQRENPKSSFEEPENSVEGLGKQQGKNIMRVIGVKNLIKSKSNQTKEFICEKCSAKFHYKCNLNRHMRIHYNDRPYICSTCGDSFVQRCHLTCHVRIHTGEKPFKCPHCDARFRHKSNVKCHVRIHTGEKPFKCSICSKPFGQKGQLTCHMAKHTGVRPHQCTQCDAKFGHKAHLSAHMRVHTGARPFACSVCSRAFSQKGNLKSHMKRHGVDVDPKLLQPPISENERGT